LRSGSDQRVDGPLYFTGLGIQRFQAAVIHPHEHLVAPGCNATIDRVATAATLVGTPYLGIVTPELLPGFCIQRIDHAEGAGGVHHTVDHERCRLDRPVEFVLVAPGEPQFIDVVSLDVLERRVALLPGVAPGRHPVPWLLVCSDQAFVGHRRGDARNCHAHGH